MQEKKELVQPTIEDMISLGIQTQMKISPNGEKVAYINRIPNWNKNNYESRCFIYDSKLNKTFQLTRFGSISQIEWIDNNSLAILKVDPELKESSNQIFVFENLIGEPWQLTDHTGGVQSFKLFGKGVLFLAKNPERSENKERMEKFGTYIHFEQEKSASALYYTNLDKMKNYLEEKLNQTNDESKEDVKPIIEISQLLKDPLSIISFIPSPQNDAIYLNCKIRDDLVYYLNTSHFAITTNPDKALESFLEKQKEKESKEKKDEKTDKETKEDFSYLGKLTKIELPTDASIDNISPDGKKLLINHKERDNLSYTQPDYWVLDIEKWKNLLGKEEELIKKMVKITNDLDQIPFKTAWVKDGIFISYAEGTGSNIVKATETGNLTKLDLEDYSVLVNNAFDISLNGYLCFWGYTGAKLTELYLSTNTTSSDKLKLKRITNNVEKIKNWNIGLIETIRWTSKDGTEIEGVLRKPLNFDPKKKYPLVFIIHGGPTWYNAENLLEFDEIFYYPSIQFSNKEILVLKVNYRGSLSRGQAFLELNKGNLGIGDLWDIESAIRYLDKQGFLDTTKIGCCGWSQGGYISAFVGLHSKQFKAVSVGAGVSDWYTYHISNDVPFFTTDYLYTSPYRDRELYWKTAPISNIKEAKTPMLIQHGEIDKRVPISNAYELYRGLKEMNVQVELFIYPGMAHPITKPRENRAIMYQNLNWFSHFLLGEDLNLLEENKEEN
ncbi:MAG TPA: prolyl oligopeptidase family serine peptidase [candidate division Zixibacteria bacterium]|nr:prolyl oligopeptidase family serine peptidase [candidate division Zixibacteria bacterium]